MNNTSDTPIGYIKITNKRRNVGPKPMPGETAVDGDRANSVLGDKHILKNHLDPVERAKVIAAYREDYVRDCAAQGPMFKATQALAQRVSKGEKIALQCRCAGIGPCHLQIVVDKASEMLGCPIEKSKTSNVGSMAASGDLIARQKGQVAMPANARLPALTTTRTASATSTGCSVPSA